MDRKFEPGNHVLYYGVVYEVFQSFKHSELIVLKNDGFMVYAWKFRCRLVTK